MDIATFVIAVLGLVVATGSAVWQAATWRLEGGRVKIELQAGAAGAGGMVVGPLAAFKPDALRRLAEQGYPTPVVAVQVRNVGRAPVTVQRWAIRHENGMEFVPLAENHIGEKLPYRLDAGEEQTFATPMQLAVALIKTSESALGQKGGVRGSVSLGDGRVHRTTEIIV